MIQDIYHVGATTSEIDQSLGIYRDRLGMSVLSDAPRQGEWIDRVTGLSGFNARVVYLTPDGRNRVELFQISHPFIQPMEPEGGPFAGVSHVCLKVKNVKELHNHLAGSGRWSEASVHRSHAAPAPAWTDQDGLRWEIDEATTDTAGMKAQKPIEIDHIGLLVSDMERSKAFYSGLLGLELAEEGEVWFRPTAGTAAKDDGIDCVFVRLRSPNGHVLELRQLKKRTVQSKKRTSIDWIGFTHVAFLAENAREIHCRLSKTGVKAISEPQAVPIGPVRGGYVYYFYDPDQITLEVVELPRQKA